MKIDIKTAASRLANDPEITDYDFWRSLKNLENKLFEINNKNIPIPIEMIRWRAILNQARSKRGRG